MPTKHSYHTINNFIFKTPYQMKRLEFSIEIDAPVEKVRDTMLSDE